MAIIDDDWWQVRRHIGGFAGSSYAPVRGSGDIRYRRTPYIRMKSRPPLRKSAKSYAATARWSRVTHAWTTTLTAPQRADWNDMADNYVTHWFDAEQYGRHMLGFNLFCNVNARRLLWGLSFVTDAYSLLQGTTLTTFTAAFQDADTVRFTFTPALGAYHALVVYSSIPFLDGRAFEIPTATWFRDQVPHGFRPQCTSAFNAASPQDLELSIVPPSGLNLTFAACGMSDTGMYGLDWLTSTDTAP